MRLKNILFALGLLGILLYLPQSLQGAGGDDPSTPLVPDGVLRHLAPANIAWYHFYYGGNQSPFQIELTDSGLSDIGFALYTPEQFERWQRGLPLKPVGQIARAGGIPSGNLLWAGNFKTGGEYYITVHNPMETVISYRLTVSGPAIQLPANGAPNESNAAINSASPTPVPSAGVVKPNIVIPTELARGGLMILTPEAARAFATRNGGVVAFARPVRLVAGAIYSNMRFQLAASGAQLLGDPNHPPTIIPPAGTYGIVAENVQAPIVKFIKIQTSTLAQDQWKWYSDITNKIHTDRRYGGILFANTQNGVIQNVTIVGADGSTDGASHSASIVGIALLDARGTLVAKNKLNGNIFGIIIGGGKNNILLDNYIMENIRQGLVPGTGDLCNGCDSCAIAIAYGADNTSADSNVIGMPGHGNWLGGGNGIFVIWNGKWQTGAGGGNHNFFIENNISAEWNAAEAVATTGNIFVRNVVNFSKNTVGFWLTGSDFSVDSHYRDGFLGAAGKTQIQVTDNRFGYNLSGVMHILENPPLPSLTTLPQAARDYLQRQPTHNQYEPIP